VGGGSLLSHTERDPILAGGAGYSGVRKSIQNNRKRVELVVVAGATAAALRIAGLERRQELLERLAGTARSAAAGGG